MSKATWEEECGLEIIDEAKSAERCGDIRKLYSTLRKIGVKNTETEFFGPDESKKHFENVSADRYENPI